MTKPRRHRIPGEEWERHKNVIKKLYLDEKRTLEGERGVMNMMKTIHGFSQYETRFRRWGFRKNLKRDDWKIIDNVRAERKQAGKSSEVYLNGELIPEEKVQKETSR
ncbi:hypothetical protein K505DRAFT_232948, partial [Melanomma pulvis-pyrius CBS 109.77]